MLKSWLPDLKTTNPNRIAWTQRNGYQVEASAVETRIPVWVFPQMTAMVLDRIQSSTCRSPNWHKLMWQKSMQRCQIATSHCLIRGVLLQSRFSRLPSGWLGMLLLLTEEPLVTLIRPINLIIGGRSFLQSLQRLQACSRISWNKWQVPLAIVPGASNKLAKGIQVLRSEP